MSNLKLSFSNSAGEELVARLQMPLNQHPKAYVLFAHCFTCGKDLNAVYNISKALAAEGFAVLRFDFTGLGESEGDFSDTNFSSNVRDLVEAAAFMADEYESPKVLIGHSLGGAAVLLASQQIESVEAVATIGAPFSPQHLQNLIKGKIDEIKKNDVAEVNIAGRTFTLKGQFLEDINSQNMESVIHSLNKSLLILHSPQDSIVGIENAKEIYQAAMHPKSYISLDGADHLLSNKKDSRYVGGVIASWVTRYLEIPEENDSLRTELELTASLSGSKYTTQLSNGKHHFVADEPLSVGGNDFGPTPYDLLLAALGSCTAMTLKMYSDRKKWNLDEVTVHLKHDKVHSDDCMECDDPSAKIDKITRVIEVEGNLDKKQRKRLLEIANKCPVHKTLHNTIEVESELVNEDD